MPISAAGNSDAPEQGFESVGRSAEHGFEPFRRSAEHGFEPSRRSAEHGFESVGRSAEHGFTLVELMVVITLIAVLSATVALAWPDPRGRLSDDADRFAARARAAHDLAIVEGRSVSVWVTSGGYGFDRREAGGWQPIADKPFRVAPWQSGIHPAITAPDGRARVIFDSTGLADVPLDLELKRGDAAAHVRIGNDGSVRVDG